MRFRTGIMIVLICFNPDSPNITSLCPRNPHVWLTSLVKIPRKKHTLIQTLAMQYPC